MAIDPLTAGLKIIDKFIPEKGAKVKAEAALRESIQKDNESQNAINLEQAKHSSLFVSGPRPFLMWVCGFGVGYTILIRPMLQDALTFWYKSAAPELTVLDMSLLTTLTIALYGIRSGEVHKGVARKAMDLKDGFFARRRKRKEAKG